MPSLKLRAWRPALRLAWGASLGLCLGLCSASAIANHDDPAPQGIYFRLVGVAQPPGAAPLRAVSCGNTAFGGSSGAWPVGKAYAVSIKVMEVQPPHLALRLTVTSEPLGQVVAEADWDMVSLQTRSYPLENGGVFTLTAQIIPNYQYC